MAPLKKEDIENVVEENADMVYRLALSRTKNKEDAQDVFQDVFLRYTRANPSFESKEHEKAWFLRVTINCSKNIVNSSWFRNTTPLTEEIKFETKEKHEIYYEVLKLPIKDRTIIHLFYYEGFKTREISEMLNIKESTVKSRLKRTREKLKFSLQGGANE